MGERVGWDVFKGRLRLKAVNRRGGIRPEAPDSIAGGWTHGVTRRLISWPDAAKSRDLREETQAMLSRLTPHEQAVLRMRFGIGKARYCSVEEIARYYALESNHILDIEAQALRKLRHPGRSLKSVSRR
jgi:RNA polymerase primary sigma factor